MSYLASCGLHKFARACTVYDAIPCAQKLTGGPV